MPTQEDMIRIVQQVAGTEKVQRLAEEYENAQEELRKYIASLASFDAAMLKTDAVLAKHAQSAAVAKEALESAQRSSGGIQGSAMAMQQLAYGIQDFASSYQYGGAKQAFMAISNNVQMIATNLGLGTKALMGFTAAGIALPMLVGPAMELIKKLFGSDDIDRLKTYEERVKDIKEAIDRSADAAKNAADALNNLFSTPAEQEAADKARKLITAGPQGAQIRAVLEGAVAKEVEADPSLAGIESKRAATYARREAMLAKRKALIAERQRTTTPGATFSLSRTEEIDNELANIDRWTDESRTSLADLGRQSRAQRDVLMPTAMQGLTRRLTQMGPGDREWVANALQAGGMGVTAGELSRLTPEQIKADRIRQQETMRAIGAPVEAMSNAFQGVLGGARQGGQKLVDAARKAGERQRAEAEDWDKTTQAAEASGKEAAAALAKRRAAQARATKLPSATDIAAGQLQGTDPQAQASALADLLRKSGMGEDAARQSAAQQVAAVTQELMNVRRQSVEEQQAYLASLQQQLMEERAMRAEQGRLLQGMQANDRFQRTLLPRGQN